LYTTSDDINFGKLPGVKLTYVGQSVNEDSTITNIIKSEGVLADSTLNVIVNAKQSR
jgi:hypothetical protein